MRVERSRTSVGNVVTNLGLRSETRLGLGTRIWERSDQRLGPRPRDGPKRRRRKNYVRKKKRKKGCISCGGKGYTRLVLRSMGW